MTPLSGTSGISEVDLSALVDDEKMNIREYTKPFCYLP